MDRDTKTQSEICFDNLKRLLNKKYVEKFNKNPSTAAEKVIECIDDEFMGEWQKYAVDLEKAFVSDISALREDYNDIVMDAHRMVDSLNKTIKESQEAVKRADEAQTIKDPRVADALKIYQMIVSMDFNDPQQNLQNIRNASYFIWALYAKGDSTPGEVFKDQLSVSNDADESSNNQWEDINFKRRIYK